MEENTNKNEQTGFVMSDPTTVQAEAHTTEYTAQPEPQPMPSQDNTYRFQNTAAQGDETKKKEKKRRVSGSFFSGKTAKLVGSAVLFGVIAAVCFIGVSKLFGFSGGSNTQVGQVDTSSTQLPVTVMYPVLLRRSCHRSLRSRRRAHRLLILDRLIHPREPDLVSL